MLQNYKTGLSECETGYNFTGLRETPNCKAELQQLLIIAFC